MIISALAFSPYARCIRYGCPLPRSKDIEAAKGLYCSEYCMQMDSSSKANTSVRQEGCISITI